MSTATWAVVVSRKGGVGKTLFARALLHYWRVRYPTAAFDGEGGAGNLVRHYGVRGSDGELLSEQSPMLGVAYGDVQTPDGIDALYELTRESQAQRVVVDFPAGAIVALEQMVSGGLGAVLAALQEYGVRPVVVQVVSPGEQCAQFFAELLEQVGGIDGTILAVKNLSFGSPEEWVFFDRGGAAKALSQVGGALVHLPRLRSRTYFYVDSLALPFGEVLRRDDVGRRADVQFLRTWLRSIEETFAGTVLA